MTTIDPTKMDAAKEWAKRMPPGGGWAHKDQSAAAEVIAALPDIIVDGDKLREGMAAVFEFWDEGDYVPPGLRTRLEALLPASSLLTLADLIEQGHDPAQYQWRQAEHRDKRCIIIRVLGHDSKLTVSLLTATGATIWTSTDEVIPHPDKPRLVWPDEFSPEPGEEIPDDDLPDHVEEALTQGIEDMKAGRVTEFDLGEENPEPQEVAPKALVTEEDYENAPYGTICAEDGHFPLYTSTWTWQTLGRDSHTHRDLSGTPRRVLRWGMGEQA